MTQTLKIVTFLALITIAVFFISNAFLGGYLSPVSNEIGNEIGAPAEALYEWNLAEKAPFKYRLLFPAIVKGSWQLLASHPQDNDTFILAYKAWSLIFLITSVVSFFFLIRGMGFENLWSTLGCILFLFSPPILLAYTLPVHTREDTLGYTLLALGLLSMMKKRIFLFFCITILGVLCRETLLILPCVFLFFSSYTKFITRAVIAGIPVMIWMGLRLFINSGAYDPWEGLKWNLDNIEQVVGFFFITFSFMWLLFFYGIFNKQKLLNTNLNPPLSFIYESGLSVFFLVVITTFIGGIFNEIRLLFLLFPWVIIISVHVLYKEQDYLTFLIRNKKYVVYILINASIFGVLCIYLVNNYHLFLEPSKFGIHFDVWIVVTLISILTTVLMIPVYIKIFTRYQPLVSLFAKP